MRNRKGRLSTDHDPSQKEREISEQYEGKNGAGGERKSGDLIVASGGGRLQETPQSGEKRGAFVSKRGTPPGMPHSERDGSRPTREGK